MVAGDKLQVNAERTALKLVPPSEAPDGIRVFLGIDRESGAGQTADGRAVFAVLVSTEPDESYAGLREIGAVLNDREAGIAVNVVGLSNWHGVHTHCANCGEHTVVIDAGHVRQCPVCGLSHFPRSDPAIIVLVTDDQDRALLGRNEAWPEGRYSTLAGFVEPGESLEAAVRREVLEETGVVVGPEVEYAGSQPWPLPSSLMLGFYAKAAEHRHRGGRGRDRRGPVVHPGGPSCAGRSRHDGPPRQHLHLPPPDRRLVRRGAHRQLVITCRRRSGRRRCG